MSEGGFKKRRRLDAGDSYGDSASMERRIPCNSQAWSDETHRNFVEAILQIGIKNASPSTIMDGMEEKGDEITTERIKSHLQKYRKHKEKSVSEFMEDYDSWIQKIKTVGAAGVDSLNINASDIAEMTSSSGTLMGGEAAASLSFAVMNEDNHAIPGKLQGFQGSQSLVKGGSTAYDKFAGDIPSAAVPSPVLTEEERRTPLGQSLEHVVQLFYSMKQHLLVQRHEDSHGVAGDGIAATAVEAVEKISRLKQLPAINGRIRQTSSGSYHSVQYTKHS